MIVVDAMDIYKIPKTSLSSTTCANDDQEILTKVDEDLKESKSPTNFKTEIQINIEEDTSEEDLRVIKRIFTRYDLCMILILGGCV